MPKLPVIETIKEALRTIWSRRVRLAYALTALTLVMTLWDVGVQYLVDEGAPTWVVLATSLFGLLIAVLFAVTCHRILLLGDDAVPRYGILSWSARETRFLGWILAGFLTFMAMCIPLMVIMTGPGPLDHIFWLQCAIVFLPIVYVFSRLSVLLPATALDQRNDIAWAWRFTENNGWRLTLIVAVIPMSGTFLPISLSVTNPGVDLLLTFATYAFTAVEIALLSASYRYLGAAQGNLSGQEVTQASPPV